MFRKFMKFFQSVSAYMIMRWKEDYEYYKCVLDRSGWFNVENVIVAGIFQEGCYSLSDEDVKSYYSEESSKFSSDSSIPGLVERAREYSYLDEESTASSWNEGES